MAERKTESEGPDDSPVPHPNVSPSCLWRLILKLTKRFCGTDLTHHQISVLQFSSAAEEFLSNTYHEKTHCDCVRSLRMNRILVSLEHLRKVFILLCNKWQEFTPISIKSFH